MPSQTQEAVLRRREAMNPAGTGRSRAHPPEQDRQNKAEQGTHPSNLQTWDQTGLPGCCYPCHDLLFRLSLFLLTASSVIFGIDLDFFCLREVGLAVQKSLPYPPFLCFRLILPIMPISISTTIYQCYFLIFSALSMQQNISLFTF